MFILYDILYSIGFLFYWPFLVIEKKWHAKFPFRFGWWAASDVEFFKGKKNIWIHAVSVGEILAVQGLIKSLHQSHPQYSMVITTVTKTGYALASEKFKEHRVIFAPLDFSFAVHQYVHHIKPQIYITAETEIWPNLFQALQSRNIPIVIVNGRISEQSFRRYRAFKYFFKKIFKGVFVFCMQTPADAERITDIGAHPGKVQVVGNMKFDDVKGTAPFFEKSAHPIWVAGSTHPGEEEIILDVFKSALEKFPFLQLILAPRHIERSEEVARLIQAKGLRPIKFSQRNNEPLDSKTVLLIDTIGHLRSLYSLADIVFVGKSLKGQGGQNIIEPAFWGKPILVGPNMQNFKDVNELFRQDDAFVEVSDAAELQAEVERLLSDPDKRRKIGERAKQVVQKHQGATAKTAAIINEILV